MRHCAVMAKSGGMRHSIWLLQRCATCKADGQQDGSADLVGLNLLPQHRLCAAVLRRQVLQICRVAHSCPGGGSACMSWMHCSLMKRLQRHHLKHSNLCGVQCAAAPRGRIHDRASQQAGNQSIQTLERLAYVAIDCAEMLQRLKDR